MRTRILIAACVCWALSGQTLLAQNVGTGIEPTGAARGHQTGTRGANFLRIGVSARARAMADAGTALTEGATVLYYNPSAAALAETFEAAVTYTDLYAGMSHAFAGAVLPLGEFGSLGAHAIVFSSGEMERTTELSPEGFDPLAGNIVEWNSVALGLTYARRITDRLALGITGKYVQEGIDFATVSFYGFDVGTMFQTGVFGSRLAAAITNIGGESRFEGPGIQSEIRRDLRIFYDKTLGTDIIVRYDTDRMEMPTTFRFGLYLPVLGAEEGFVYLPGNRHRVDLLTEVDDGFDSDIEARIGFEYAFQEMFFVRGGKYFQNEGGEAPWDWNDGLSGGFGIRLPFLADRHFSVDYAYTNMGILDGVHMFGLQVGS